MQVIAFLRRQVRCMCVHGAGRGVRGRIVVYLLILRPSYLSSYCSWPSLPSCSASPLCLNAPSLAQMCCSLLWILLSIPQKAPSGSERNRGGTAAPPAAASRTPGNSGLKRRQFVQAGCHCLQAGCKWCALLSASPYCCHPDRGNKTPLLWRSPVESSRAVNTGQQVARPCRIWRPGSTTTGRAHPGSRRATPRLEQPRLLWKVKMVQPFQSFSSLNIRTLQLNGCTFQGCWDNPHSWRKMILPSANPSGSYRALCYSDMTYLHQTTN